MDKCASIVKNNSGGMGTQHSLWSAPFKGTVKNSTELSDGGADGIKLNSRVKTFRYKLMNEWRLLWKSLFFYNKDK